jgi:hypothetical protein
VIGLCLGTGIAFSFSGKEGRILKGLSMPVISSQHHLFAKPLLYTQFGMVSVGPLAGVLSPVGYDPL